MTSDIERLLTAACVVIPTYNEAENLPRLLEALRGLSQGLRILVVDDASPDGTGRVAEGLRDPLGIEVLHRPGKSGRGSAVLAGFRRALSLPGVLYLLEMDADFSHDPRELPGMLEALGEADMAVRSRYAPGSRIVDWTLGRRVLSRLANALARALLGLPLSDCTNGYRAYRRQALEALDFDRIESSGYIVLSEVACRLHRKGLRFAELPTLFVNRSRGRSNLTLGELARALGGILRLCRRSR